MLVLLQLLVQQLALGCVLLQLLVQQQQLVLGYFLLQNGATLAALALLKILEQQIALVVLALLNLLAQQHQVALGNALLQLDDALAVLASVHGSLGQHQRLCALCKLLPLTKLDLALVRILGLAGGDEEAEVF